MDSNKEDENKKIHDSMVINDTEKLIDMPSHIYDMNANKTMNTGVVAAEIAGVPAPPVHLETSGSKLNELLLKSSIETDNKTSDVYTTINDDDPNGTITAPADDITYSNLNEMAMT